MRQRKIPVTGVAYVLQARNAIADAPTPAGASEFSFDTAIRVGTVRTHD